MQINPGLSFVKISAGLVQIGSGERSLQISGVTPQVTALLEKLRRGIPDGSEPRHGKQAGLSTQETWRLISTLDPVLLNSPAEPSPEPSTDCDVATATATLQAVTVEPSSQHDADEKTSVQVCPVDAPTLHTRRAQSSVQILGTGRSGRALALLLANAGVARMWVWDPQPVTVSDLGTGFLPEDLSRCRGVATAEQLRHQFPDIEILPQSHPVAPQPCGDLSVCITRGGLATEFLDQAQRRAQPVLPVTLHDDRVVIGPWLLPQTSPCPHCWMAREAELDPSYADRQHALRAQAAGREPLGLAYAVAGLVGVQVLNWIDATPLRDVLTLTDAGEVPGAVPGQVLSVSARTGAVSSFTISEHPRCCGAVAYS
ncbi:ThiF family adenylyltransferase [Auritidibacter ignavus]|uniref:ThiF family adenylyltransferase n=1 Tax=Auritidibacter ignavus TaxID=678932 RepID=UPI0024B8AEBF|nr:ThiF family adenylyltransferase [Auritidibacter ignavus]WHS28370.1 hypothetical protein QM395_01130 [Auritidibacter ignavus]